MASQSPADVPATAAEQAQRKEYLDGWRAISALLRAGKSFSGRERDCCFLNLGAASGRFADVSSAVGLDSPGDGRGVALCDWDGDGDLDFWMTSRTGPRLQLYLNHYDAGGHFLALRLRGTTSNRDAIGARVELYRSGEETPLLRTLRAGEGFLAQSSKWIHFGLGPQTGIERVVVRWPGGDPETFTGFAADRQYTLVQGSGRPEPWTRPGRAAALTADSPASPTTPGAARIVLPARLPLPELAYLGLDGQPRSVESTGRPRLINLWATWCQPCVAELREFGAGADRLAAAGLDVLLLSVDNVGDADQASADQVNALLDRLQAPPERGFATPALSSLFDLVQRVVVNRYTPLPVPTSFLLDAQGRLAVIYKGPVTVDQLLTDVGALPANEREIRDLAVAMPGRWYTSPFPPDVLAIPQALYEAGDLDASLAYLLRHLPTTSAEARAAWPSNVTAERVRDLYLAHGAALAKAGRTEPALAAFRAAVAATPDDLAAHMGLFTVLAKTGQDAAAVAEAREMVRRWPGQPLATNNLAWLLATSREPGVANPSEAVALAQDVCQRSGYREPQALATLAEAFAAAGRFDEAAKTAQQGFEQARSKGEASLADRLEGRVRAYREGRRAVE